MKDKYTAVWVSHSSINDFLRCPRAYYLNNIYRDPHTRHKITLMLPPLALGQTVHAVIEALSVLPTGERLKVSLIERFEKLWQKVSGKRGGFHSDEQEAKFKERGRLMLRRVMEHPGPLKEKAVKINQELPYYWLSEDDNIILCGKIDWLEYIPKNDSVHIIDFKTGRIDEQVDSLQLPIYLLLAKNCQKRQVSGASYWYLDRENEPKSVKLPEEAVALEKIMGIAKKIKLARQLEVFKCPGQTGCNSCKPLERVVHGQAVYVGVDEYNQDVYVSKEPASDESESILL